MDDKYIHINVLLHYIKNVEKKKFKVINSEDYNILGYSSFKAIIPEKFKVSKIVDSEEGFPFKILDVFGRNALDGPNIFFLNSELYSTETEKSVCILLSDIDEGFLVFNGFRRIPIMVSSSEILKNSY